MRWHELALQRWFNRHFVIEAGYPVPVIFSLPMNAFAHFRELWSRADNPFSYLLELKDRAGNDRYLPHPAPPRYPFISIHRTRWNLRAAQNYSTKRWRHVAWPTVAADVLCGDLANVMTTGMPAAWDYYFQVDFHALTPMTLSAFITRLQSRLRFGGGEPQTWISVTYPGHTHRQAVRLSISGGNIDFISPPEPEPDSVVSYRASFTLLVEGYNVNLNYEAYPALWTLVMQDDGETLLEEDLRVLAGTANTIRSTRPNIPPCEPAEPEPEPEPGPIYLIDELGNYLLDENGNYLTVPGPPPYQ